MDWNILVWLRVVTSTLVLATATSSAIANSEVLGFEDIAGWYSNHSTVFLESDPVVEGNSALAVPVSGYTRVMSSNIQSSDVVFPDELTQLWVDLRIPSDHAGWIGNLEPVIRVPDAGIWWRTLNAVNLNDLDRDRYVALSFQIPADLAEALRSGSYFTIYFNLNANGGNSPWLLDDLRFSERATTAGTNDPPVTDDQPPLPSASLESFDLGAAGDYNAYVFETYTAQSSDVQGRLFAGGDVDINHYSVGDRLQASTAGDVLVAGGDIRFPSGAAYFGNIIANGSVSEIGSSVSSGMAQGATITGYTTLPFDPVETRLHLEELSADLSMLAPNGEVAFQWGGLYLTGDNSSDVQVFQLDGGQLLSSHTFSVDRIPAGAHVVFNISGTSTGLTNMSMEAMAAHNTRTLYNFHEAQALQLSGVGIHGTVLAPHADINNPQGVIYGSLVARSWNGPMQLNHDPFVPFESASNPPAINFEQFPDSSIFSGPDIAFALVFSDPDGDLSPHSLSFQLNEQDVHADCDTHDTGASCVLSSIGEGSHQLVATIYDASGHVARADKSFEVDRTPPQIQFTSPPPNSRTNNPRPNWTIEFDDLGAGVDTSTLDVRITNGPSLECVASADSATCQPAVELTDGAYSLTATIQDVAGHQSDIASTTISVDTAPPVISVTHPPLDSTTYSGQLMLLGQLDEPAILTINGQHVSLDNEHRFAFPTTLNFGAYQWTLVAKDDAGSITELEHRIVRSRSVPSIVSTPPNEVRAGNTYTYTVEATDPDPDDVLTFALDTAAPGLLIDAQTGVLSWSTPADAMGEYGVSIAVTDQNNDVSTQSFTILVQANSTPIALPQSLQTDESEPLAITLSGNDPDGDDIQFSIVQLPEHGTLTGSPPSLTYTPDSNFVGQDQFLIIASDYARSSDASPIDIEVLPALRAPEITSVPDKHVAERALYTYDVVATDENAGDALSYSLLESPPGMAIDQASGQIQWLATTHYLSSVAAPNTACVVGELPDTGAFEPVVKWSKEFTHRSIGTPIVGPLVDTNGDGLHDQLDNPTIVYATHSGNLDFAPGQLVAVRGDDGRQHWASSVQTSATAVPAIGDIDGDLIPDVIMYLHDGGVAALNNDGTVKWTSVYPARVGDYNYGAINLADIDGDGQVEILARDHVLNSDGSLRFTLPVSSHAATIYAADFNADGVQELVQGERVFTATGADYWDNSDKGWSHSAYANFDGDPHPELIASSYTDIRLIDHDGSIIWSIPFPGGGSGAPTVGDMTGDGLPNIGVAGRNYYLVIDAEGSVLWKNRIEENTSHRTSSTLFDFDGDGAVEILYADTRYIRAYDGATGLILFSVYRESPTTKEYPVVADIDNDGHAEFIYNGYGLTVYEDANDSWAPTRGIWNQYDYNIFNVNDNGTIPPRPDSGLMSHNSFRLNAFPDQSSRGLIDLRVHTLELTEHDQRISISAVVENRGLADMRAPTTVEFFSGDPAAGGQSLGGLELDRLDAGQSTTLSIAGLDIPAVTDDVFATVAEQATNQECTADNNNARGALVVVRATDSAALYDEQRFVVNVGDVNEPPAIQTLSLDDATVGKSYQTSIVAIDPDIGDGLQYTLIDAPFGFSINASTGRVQWAPFTSQAGTHDVIVQVTDLRGLSDQRAYSVTVIDPLELDKHGLCGVIEHDEDRVRQGRFSIDSEDYYFVSSVGSSYFVQVYNINRGHITHTIPLPTSTRVTQPAASPDGKYIYVPRVGPDRYRYVERISTETHSITRSYRGSSSGWRYIRDSIVSPDGNFLYLTDYSRLYTLELTRGSMTSIHIDPERQGQEDFGGIALSHDGRTLYTVGRAGGLAFAVNPETRQKIASIPHGVGKRWSGSTTTLAMSNDAKRVYVSHTTNPNIAVIDSDPDSPSYNQKIATLDTGGYITRYVQVSSDDRYLYANTTDPAHVIVFGTDPSIPESYHQLAHTIDIAQDGQNPGRIEFHRSDDAYIAFSKRLKVVCQKDNVLATPPSIISQPPSQVQVGDSDGYYYKAEVSDPDAGDIHFFLLAQRPDGMVIDEFTGEVTWTPTAAQVGLHYVTIRVFDSEGLYYVKRFSIQVDPPNEAPTITSTPATGGIHGLAYSYDLQAQDPDGDALTYRLTSAPGGMAIEAATGTISWTPASGQTGPNAVSVAVDDLRGGTDQQSFVIDVAVNTPPTVGGVPGSRGKTGFAYSYDMAASNAEPEILQYTLTSAPAGMSIDVNGYISWLPRDNDIGQHLVTARVTDAVQFVEQTWSLEVLDGGTPVTANIHLEPAVVDPDQSTLITVSAGNAAGDVTRNLSVDGVPVALNAQGQASYSTTELGAHQLLATVSDVSGSASAEAELFVRDPNDTDHPLVTINSLIDGQVLTAPYPVDVTVSDENLAGWSLDLRETDGTLIRQLAAGTAPTAAQPVAQIDPTLLRNGLYVLELHASDAGANASTLRQAFVIDGQMKVGPFQVAFEDLSIPASGIPLVLTRAYDTRDKAKPLGFGAGWRTDYQGVRLQRSRELGRDWGLREYSSGFTTTYCVEPDRTNLVVVTLPDGQTERFATVASPRCNDFQPILDVDFAFEALTSRGYALEDTSGIGGRLINGHIADPGQPDQPADSDRFELTTPEGYVYRLDAAFGVRSVTDPNGNTVTYADNAVTHSSGLSFTITRDAAGRITEVTDPNGAVLAYNYDDQGQLTSVTDRAGHVTQYTYDANGNLTQLIDPTNTPVIHNAYDADGRLQSQTDAAGLSVQFTYDIPGRQQIVRDRNGNATVYIYDDRGNVISETNALGQTITRTYEGDNLISQTNPLGQTTSFTYDAQDNQTSETDPLGNTTTSSYDGGNRLLTLTGPDGTLQVSNQYNGFGLPTAITDALGNTTQFTYNQFGDLLTVTDSIGQVTTNTYNARGYKTSETTPNGQRTDWTYDNNGNPLTETVTVTRPDGSSEQRQTVFEYDGEGRVVRTTLPDGSVTQTQYDGNGNPIAETDALGRTTATVYDGNGQPITVTHPDGSTTRTQYDGNGNVTQTTDQAGRQSVNVYDAADRLTQSTIAVGTSDEAVTTSSYDAAGRLSQTTDANGNSSTNTYDAAGRRTSTTDALGNITRFEYDGEGQTTAEIDPNGNRTSYTLDANGRRTVTTYADASRTQTQYDALGRRTAHTDELGQTTHFEYTPDNQLSAVINPLGERTEYTYDSNGNKLSQTDAEGRTTTWTYDNLNRPTARTLPLGQTETHQYDVAGRRTQSTDFNGNTITYSYDSLERETERTYTDGTRITTSYAPTGQISAVTRFDPGNPMGLTTTYAYDNQDRLTQTADPFGNSISYTYDANGNRTAQIKLGQTTTYQYDAANRLTTVAAPEGTTTYGYDAAGNQTRTDRPNGVSTISEYDNRNWLTRTAQIDNVGTILADSQYILAANSQRLSETNANGTATSYTYDAANKLIESIVTDTAGNTQTTSWTFDAAGNRLTETKDGITTTYTVDANDRLTQASDGTTTTTYSYDDQGNLLSETDNGTQVVTYSYSGDYKLIQSTSNSQSASYVYDAANNRIEQTAGGSTTRYLIDPNFAFAQVVAELDQSNIPTTLYSIGNQRISQTNAQTGETSYLHQDGLGSTRLITDETGNDVGQYRYSQYGELAEQAGSGSSNFLYAGEQRDQATGNYYLRARYYDPGKGRLTQFDPFQGFDNRPITLHKYLYGNADPINTVDPSGNFGLAAIGTGFNIGGRAALVGGRAVIGRSVIQRVIQASGAFRLTKSVVTEAEKCSALSSASQKCNLFNVIVLGLDMGDARTHVMDAQLGARSNQDYAGFDGIPIRPSINYQSAPAPARWYANLPECVGLTGRAVGKDCDEYAFSRSQQGGPIGYARGQVSLRPISLSRNRAAGRLYGRWANSGGKARDGEQVLIIPASVGRSFYVRDGKVGY